MYLSYTHKVCNYIVMSIGELIEITLSSLQSMTLKEINPPKKVKKKSLAFFFNF